MRGLMYRNTFVVGDSHVWLSKYQTKHAKYSESRMQHISGTQIIWDSNYLLDGFYNYSSMLKMPEKTLARCNYTENEMATAVL